MVKIEIITTCSKLTNNISSLNCIDLQRCETPQRCGFSQRFLDANCNFSQRCDLKCVIVNANYDDQFSQIEAKLGKISHICTIVNKVAVSPTVQCPVVPAMHEKVERACKVE